MEDQYYSYKFNASIFNKKIILQEGSIKIHKNRTTLLTGENGTGKSTLLEQIHKLFLRGSIFISQENEEIFENLTVMENITLNQTSINEKEVIYILRKYKIEGILDKSSKTLSGGEKRMVSVLRGLLAKENIILMDEPTNDLDYRMVDIILNIMDDFKGKKTILCVTHDERMYTLATCIYKIENKKLEIIYNIVPFGKEIEYKHKQNRLLRDKNIIGKIFQRDYCQVILFLIIMAVTSYFFVSTLKSMNFKIDKIKDNQIELCNTLYQPVASLLNEGYLPTSIISFLAENINSEELEKKIQEILETQDNSLYSLSLDISDDEEYNVYTLGLYDVKNCIYYSVLDTYIDEVLGLNSEEYFIDTSEYFLLPEEYSKGKKPIKFKKSEYDVVMKNIENQSTNELENAFVVIQLADSYSFEKFILRDELKDLWDGNYFIRTNETIYMVETAKKINACKEKIKNWAMISGVLLIMLFINIFLFLGLAKQKMRILANYGFDKNNIFDAFMSRNGYGVLYFVVGGILIISMSVLLIYFRNSFDIRELIIPASFILICVITQMIQRKVCWYQIQKIFRIEGEL